MDDLGEVVEVYDKGGMWAIVASEPTIVSVWLSLLAQGQRVERKAWQLDPISLLFVKLEATTKPTQH